MSHLHSGDGDEETGGATVFHKSSELTYKFLIDLSSLADVKSLLKFCHRIK